MARQFDSLSDPSLLKLICDGAIGVIPTDTVYGLVGLAGNRTAIERLYQVKQRGMPPGTTIGSSVESFVGLGFDRSELQRIEHFWPASLSVVLDAEKVAPYLKQNRRSLPVRIPSNDELHTLLSHTGPLMTTSANQPGEPVSVNIQQAIDYFGNEVDFYVDGGDLSDRPPSTIIGFDEQGEIIVFRHGAVDVNERS